VNLKRINKKKILFQGCVSKNSVMVGDYCVELFANAMLDPSKPGWFSSTGTTNL
jgi:hypothetical protein